MCIAIYHAGHDKLSLPIDYFTGRAVSHQFICGTDLLIQLSLIPTEQVDETVISGV